MKYSVYLFIVGVSLLLIGTAIAVPPGKTVEYQDGAMGQVVFDGKIHADAGKKCNDCHPKVFQMKKGSVKITMADHKPGRTCGACHDGSTAFKQQGNCKKCHKK